MYPSCHCSISATHLATLEFINGYQVIDERRQIKSCFGIIMATRRLAVVINSHTKVG